MVDIIAEINRMQDHFGRQRITTLNQNWKVFYEEDKGHAKGFCILFCYDRLTCEPDYMTGKIAEIMEFTFPEYKGTGVGLRLLKRAIQYAKQNKIDLVCDSDPDEYEVLTKMNFVDSTERRIWLRLSGG